MTPEPWYLPEDDGIAMGPENEVSPSRDQPTKKEAEAEYDRLQKEMQDKMKKGVWKGVEEDYQDILALRGVPVKAKVHHGGAEAARNLGNLLEYYRREQKAREKDPDDDDTVKEVIEAVEQNIAYIERNYGFVAITLPAPSSYSLVPSEYPFESAGIVFVNTKLKETGSFKGLLPVVGITYTLVPAEGGETAPATQEQISRTFQSIEESENDDYQEIKPVKINGKKVSAAKATAPKKRGRMFYGEAGLTAGSRTTSPTYGREYVMKGADVALFGGLHSDIPVARNFALRPGGRIGFGITTQEEREAASYELTHSYAQGDLRLHILCRTKPVTLGGGILAGHGLNSSPKEEAQISVGSAEVALNHLKVVQTPVLGASIFAEKEFASGALFLEFGFRRAVIGIEGEVVENPEWTSGAPFASNAYQLGLGVVF